MALLASKPGPYAVVVYYDHDNCIRVGVNIPNYHPYNRFLSETLQRELVGFEAIKHMKLPIQVQLAGVDENGPWICMKVKPPQDYDDIMKTFSEFMQVRNTIEHFQIPVQKKPQIQARL